jgi:long-chain fatty acid transport protein
MKSRVPCRAHSAGLIEPMTIWLCRKLVALAVVVSITLSAAVAAAGGPAFTRMFAPAETAQTAYLSPAGMTRLKDPMLTGQMILGTSFSDFEVDDSLTTNTGGDPRSPTPVVVPSLYYVRPLFSDDWRIGLTLNAPGGFGAQSGPNWAGRYYNDESSLIFIAGTFTVAYRVTRWLSLGTGVSVQYSSASSKTQVVNPGPTDSDAKLKTDADGVGVGGLASALIEFSDQTRFGITWHSETNPDQSPEVRLRSSTLPPAVVKAINRAGNNIDATLRTPQHVDMGLYHGWGNGWSATVDVIWVDFSRFGLTELRVNSQNLTVPESKFQDFWVVSAGVEFPLRPKLNGRIGVMYLEQPVSDNDRTFSFALDRAWGLGVGMVYTRESGSLIDLNLSAFKSGDGSIDTGEASASAPRGRVAGKDDTPWSMAIEFTYHFAF